MSKSDETVLVVDDEPTDLEMLHDTLASAGYAVITAANGRDAIAAVERSGGHIDLVVTDVAMAPMNGCELAHRLTTADPGIRVIFVSGYSGALAYKFEDQPVTFTAFLQKPFEPKQLLSMVEQVLQPA